jgi:hypothetical protein
VPEPARPENGTDIISPQMARGVGAIRIINRRAEDLIAEIWDWGPRRRIVREVYIRSAGEVTLSEIGLGLYKARFRSAAAGGNSYASTDVMEFYDIESATRTESVLYVITIP